MKIIYTTFIFAAALLSIACQTNSTINNAANQTANKTTANADQIANKTVKPETNTNANDVKTETNSTSPNSASPNSASTPTAAYKAAYAARKNKDIKALKQLISKDMFEFFEMIREGEPNALDAGLKELCEMPQGSTDESRNEKIKGDTATLEYLDEKGAWKTMDFVKEDGAWKLTIAKIDGDKNSK